MSRAPSMLRQQEHGDRFDDRHREQEHHHGAVHREELVVGAGVEEGHARIGELDAHQQREHAGAEEEQKARGDVENADVGVVDLGEEGEAPRHGPGRLEALEAVRPGRLRVEHGRRAAACAPLAPPSRAPSVASFQRLQIGGERDAAAGLRAGRRTAWRCRA